MMNRLVQREARVQPPWRMSPRVDKLPHGDENVVRVPMPATGVEKRSEHADREVIWQVAARRSTYKMLDKRSALYKAKRKIEKAKAQVRAKVEPRFA